MKRILSVMLAVLMLAALFTGCSKKEAAAAPNETKPAPVSPVGRYSIESMGGKSLEAYYAEENGLSVEEYLAQTKEIGVDVHKTHYLEIYDDGTFLMVESNTHFGNWTQEGDTLTFTVDDETYTGTFRDGRIELELDLPIVFVKETASK
jgi:predicted small lipoprotein YifL